MTEIVYLGEITKLKQKIEKIFAIENFDALCDSISPELGQPSVEVKIAYIGHAALLLLEEVYNVTGGQFEVRYERIDRSISGVDISKEDLQSKLFALAEKIQLLTYSSNDYLDTIITSGQLVQLLEALRGTTIMQPAAHLDQEVAKVLELKGKVSAKNSIPFLLLLAYYSLAYLFKIKVLTRRQAFQHSAVGSVRLFNPVGPMSTSEILQRMFQIKSVEQLDHFLQILDEKQRVLPALLFIHREFTEFLKMTLNLSEREIHNLTGTYMLAHAQEFCPDMRDNYLEKLASALLVKILSIAPLSSVEQSSVPEPSSEIDTLEKLFSQDVVKVIERIRLVLECMKDELNPNLGPMPQKKVPYFDVTSKTTEYAEFVEANDIRPIPRSDAMDVFCLMALYIQLNSPRS